MTSSAKKPKKTAAEAALEKRQSMLLDQEIEESEEMLKALARGKLGRKSLLSGAAETRSSAAGGGSRGGGSMLSGIAVGTGGGSSSAVGGSSATPSSRASVTRIK